MLDHDRVLQVVRGIPFYTFSRLSCYTGLPVVDRMAVAGKPDQIDHERNEDTNGKSRQHAAIMPCRSDHQPAPALLFGRKKTLCCHQFAAHGPMPSNRFNACRGISVFSNGLMMNTVNMKGNIVATGSGDWEPHLMDYTFSSISVGGVLVDLTGNGRLDLIANTSDRGNYV